MEVLTDEHACGPQKDSAITDPVVDPNSWWVYRKIMELV